MILSIDTYHYEGAYQKLYELAEQLRIHIPNWQGHQSYAISCCARLLKTINWKVDCQINVFANWPNISEELEVCQFFFNMASTQSSFYSSELGELQVIWSFPNNIVFAHLKQMRHMKAGLSNKLIMSFWIYKIKVVITLFWCTKSPTPRTAWARKTWTRAALTQGLGRPNKDRIMTQAMAPTTIWWDHFVLSFYIQHNIPFSW